MTRLVKAGYTCELTPVGELSQVELRAVEEAAERWLGGRGERGFSMALDAPLGEHGDTLLVIGRDSDGCLRGLLHFVPAYGRPAASLSAMRRDTDTPNGLTEFMIVRAIEELRSRRIEDVSLNFAAFARLLHSPEGMVERALGRLLSRADAFFQIERLYRFNAKFGPRWEARYLMHEGAMNLPRAALASLWLEGQLPRIGRRRSKPGRPGL